MGLTDDNKPPRWNLRDLFPSREGPEFRGLIDSVTERAAKFASRYKGKTARLNGNELFDAVEEYEAILEDMGRINAYAALIAAADQTENAFAARTRETLSKPQSDLIFFGIEINKMKEADLLDKIITSRLAEYSSWIGKLRSWREHQLPDEAEKYIRQKTPTAEDAWKRLYNQTMLGLTFRLGDRDLTAPEISNVMNHDPDPVKRHEAYAEFTRVLGKNKKTFGLITNTLADLKHMSDRRRSFDKPEESRHLSNQIDDDVVGALVKCVRDSYHQTSHRYYAWKARKFGVTALHPADRNASLPGAGGRKYSWEEARDIVVDAYRRLSPEMGDIAARFFSEGWIDAEPRKNKAGGAFAASTVPSAHSYIMMNFFGSARDVMTLAHELGHGIHQTLAKERGYLRAQTPLTLAETASVFGEMLVFQKLLAEETDLHARRALLASKVEDMLNTIVRQTAFYVFEQRLHAECREKGELPPERISSLWMTVQRESLGSSVNLDVPGTENMWMAVPHFIGSPFYVYAYAFGNCLVNALYDEYSETADKKGFVQKYRELLSAGGTRGIDAALSPFGFDPADPDFWKKGLSVVDRYINTLLDLDRQIEPAPPATAKGFNEAAEKPAKQKPVKEKKPKPRGPS